MTPGGLTVRLYKDAWASEELDPEDYPGYEPRPVSEVVVWAIPGPPGPMPWPYLIARLLAGKWGLRFALRNGIIRRRAGWCVGSPSWYPGVRSARVFDATGKALRMQTWESPLSIVGYGAKFTLTFR